MTKITIVKNYRGKETLRVTELEEVVRFIQTSAYAEAVASSSVVRNTSSRVPVRHPAGSIG